MKFINYLESITGVGIYPLTSFIIFFTFFALVSLYVLKVGKAHFDEAARIPMDSNEN